MFQHLKPTQIRPTKSTLHTSFRFKEGSKEKSWSLFTFLLTNLSPKKTSNQKMNQSTNQNNQTEWYNKEMMRQDRTALSIHPSISLSLSHPKASCCCILHSYPLRCSNVEEDWSFVLLVFLFFFQFPHPKNSKNNPRHKARRKKEREREGQILLQFDRILSFVCVLFSFFGDSWLGECL